MTYKEAGLPTRERRGAGVVLVDPRGRLAWWSSAMQSELERAGLEWKRGMRCCDALGCAPDGCLTEQALAAPDELEARPCDGHALDGTFTARTIPSGTEDMVAFELYLDDAAGRDAAPERDVVVAALGRLSVTVEGQSRDGDWLQQRPGQVFRYLLASREGAQRSEAIASALWPERGPSAVANVRYCIFKLREQLGERGDTADSLVARDAAGYRIDMRRVELDVDVFQAKSAAGISAHRNGDPARAEAILGEALALYRGEFLADDPYADWAFSEREYLRSMAGKDLAAMAQIAIAGGPARGRDRAPAAARAARALRFPRPPDADRGLPAPRPPHRGPAPLPRAARAPAPRLRRAAGLRADEPRRRARRAPARGRGGPAAAGARRRARVRRTLTDFRKVISPMVHGVNGESVPSVIVISPTTGSVAPEAGGSRTWPNGGVEAAGDCPAEPDRVESSAMSTLADDSVRHYLNLPYRITLTRDGEDEERPWRAAVEELAGCEARGSTPTDAAARIPSAIAEWVASAQAEGREVPEPRGSRAYSGRLLLRMPQSLHSDLAEAAEREQVSLNAYINVLLVAALQSRRPDFAGPPVAEQVYDAERAPEAGDGMSHTARLQRFLAIALTANVAVVAIAAAIAVVLLISAT